MDVKSDIHFMGFIGNVSLFDPSLCSFWFAFLYEGYGVFDVFGVGDCGGLMRFSLDPL